MRILSDIDRFSEVVASIYSAALDPSHWQAVLDRLQLESGGTATHIIGYDFETGMDLGFITAGYDDAFLQSYAAHYCHKNVWAAGWIQYASGRPIFSQQMYPLDELLKTEFYNDWVRPQEDRRAGGGVLFHKSQGRMFALGGNIRKKDEETLEPAWMRAVHLLKPHLERAFEINRRMAGRSLVENLASPIQRGASTVLVISAKGRLLYASEAAGLHLARDDLFRCDTLNRISLVEDEAETTLRRALFAIQAEPVLWALTCKSQRPGSRYRRTYEFIAFASGAQAASDLGFICGANENCLLVTMTHEETSRSPARELMHAYQLTQAEADVALLLSDGRSAVEIAGLRSAAITTVRNQIKAAMTKCGVRRQLDLVRVVERNVHGGARKINNSP